MPALLAKERKEMTPTASCLVGDELKGSTPVGSDIPVGIAASRNGRRFAAAALKAAQARLVFD